MGVRGTGPGRRELPTCVFRRGFKSGRQRQGFAPPLVPGSVGEKITRTKHTRRISLLSSCCVAIRSLECTRLVVLRQSGPGRETSCRREACRGLSRCVAGRGYLMTTEYTIECYCGAQSLLWVEKKIVT